MEQTFGLADPDTTWIYLDFIEEFGITVPKDYSGNHISPDGMGIEWRNILKRLFSKSYRERNKYYDLTVGDLERMIKTNVWGVG